MLFRSDLVNGKALGSVDTGDVSSVSFGAEGARLVSGNMEKTDAVVWDYASRKPIRTFPNQRYVAYSRDGRFIAFTSNWEKSGRYDLFIVKIDSATRIESASRCERT